ncbi:MAG: Phosphoglycolate phosphatase, chromosomal [Verrucomicrobiota bacterium]
MKLRLAVFDLDGTLVDSRDDLAAAVAAMRRHFQLPPLGGEAVQAAIGDGAYELARRTLADAPEIPVEEGLSRLLSAYREAICVHTRPYPGVTELLRGWRDSGLRLALLTNKPQEMSDALLRALGMQDFFAVAWGPEGAGCRKPDPAGLRRLMAIQRVSAQETVLVGDHHTDSRCARGAGVSYLHFSGGLGRLEPEDPVADFVFSRHLDLLDWRRIRDSVRRG